MHTDLPLSNKKDDELGRYLFAEEIANGLVNSFENNNDSVVLGINGSWGCGKSTLVNFIIKEIERVSGKQEKEIIVLRFNPWMFSGQKELQNIFLKELYLKFESQKDKLKKASKKLADFLGHLNWLKYIHSGTGDAIKDTKTFLEGLNREKDLSQLKHDIDKLLIESGVKLYITIDDIDRLTPSEITDIFQLVKLNGNFANTVFLLAYDREVVTGALKNQFGENGRKYIEKIIQVDYSLPSISKNDIQRIFINSLHRIFSDVKLSKSIDKSFSNIKNESFLKLFNSLRDVYRFNNSIKLRFSSIYRELNIRDFFLIEALRIFKPKAYDFVIESKEKLTHNNEAKSVYLPTSINNNDESKSDFIDKQDFDSITKSILNNLFLLTEEHFFNHVTSEDLIRQKRIANPNYFDRYFNLQLSNLDIQESVFIEFIEDKRIALKVKILEGFFTQKKYFNF